MVSEAHPATDIFKKIILTRAPPKSETTCLGTWHITYSTSLLRPFTSSHLRIFASSHLYIFTSSRLCVFASFCLLVFPPSAPLRDSEFSLILLGVIGNRFTITHRNS